MPSETTIAIFCYRRTDMLQQVIAALLKNPECAGMDAMFFCDGYKGGHDKEDVLKTRAYVASVTGFRNVYLQNREKNYGAGQNISAAITYLSRNCDRFIIVEDDVVFTQNAICFLLDALDFYKDSPSVFAVTGHCFPLQVHEYSYDSVVHRRFSSYGWASWNDRVANLNWNAALLQQMIDKTPAGRRTLNAEGKDLYRRLRKQAGNRLCTYDIQLQAHIALNNLHVVYPVVSKLKNIGFDANATHTYGLNYTDSPLDESNRRTFSFCAADDIQPELVKQLRKPFRLSSLITRKVYNSCIRYKALLTRRYFQPSYYRIKKLNLYLRTGNRLQKG